MLRGKSTITRWRRASVALVVAFLATFTAVRLFVEGSGNDSPDVTQPQDIDVAGRLYNPAISDVVPVEPAPEPVSVSLTLDHSGPAAAVLQEAGLDPADAQKWAAYLAGDLGVRRFESGHGLTFYKDPQTGDLRGIKYNLDERVAINEQTYGAGVLRSSQDLIRYTVRPVAVSFRLHNGFHSDAMRADLPEPIVATLEYAFKEKHALSRLPIGSDVKLIYEEKVSRDGTSHLATGLQAAQISFAGRTLSAFAFRDENGHPRLFDSNGNALEAESLRFPLKFEYISSGFTDSRFHPILHHFRPHLGVDLVARYGTPVKAVADGQIEAAGWCGELGRCVKIHHTGDIVSVYGHLAHITPGLSPGVAIRVGEVIGRVGMSGLSTGPHLHYGLEKDGRFVNPLTASLGVDHRVSPRMSGLFERFKRQYIATLERLPDLGGRVHLAHTVTASPSQADAEVAAVRVKRIPANNIAPVVVMGQPGETAALDPRSLTH